MTLAQTKFEINIGNDRKKAEFKTKTTLILKCISVVVNRKRYGYQFELYSDFIAFLLGAYCCEVHRTEIRTTKCAGNRDFGASYLFVSVAARISEINLQLRRMLAAILPV